MSSNEIYKFVELRYEGNTPLKEAFDEYMLLPEFRLNQNILEVTKNYSADIQEVTRLVTQYHLTLAFKAMKVDLDDDNTSEDLNVGNIGTPGRLAKMWIGSGLDDSSELLSGRWTKPPRMASFPNTHKKRLPITKRVDLVSCCSHHIAPFSSFFREDAYAIVSYIPKDKVLGISKLQRVVDWVARRGWLQEDLCRTIYEEVAKVAETQSVFVSLVNISHTCESLRGSQTSDGSFTTEYYGGEFEDPILRKEVRG